MKGISLDLTALGRRVQKTGIKMRIVTDQNSSVATLVFNLASNLTKDISQCDFLW